MASSTERIERLDREGLLVCDDLLPWTVFERFRTQVYRSWEMQQNWMTRLRGLGRERALPLQPHGNMEKIGALLNAHDNDLNEEFSFLYHCLHEENDTSDLIPAIGSAVIAAWQAIIEPIITTRYETNFSLTAYTPYCRLSSHTDYSNELDAYRLTLILYFSDGDRDQAPLHFKYNGHNRILEPKPNRGVLFVPTPATEHWIEPVPTGIPETLRLAFSGWIV